ncbi:MAG: vWA domain-containing protein [Bacteroidota bacterium]
MKVKDLTTFVFLFLMLIALAIPKSMSAQNKGVVVVFDDSGSMNGAPFLSVDYALQLIISFLSETDQLYIVKGSNSQIGSKISLLNPQSSIDEIKDWNNDLGNGNYFMAETAFKILKNEIEKEREKSLIIISDGKWGDLSSPYIEEEVRQIINETQVNVIFLSIESDFEGGTTLKSLLKKIPVIEILSSKPTSNDLRGNLIKIAKKLSACPEKGFDVKQSGNQVSFSSELPLKELIVLHQEAVLPQNLSKLETAEIESLGTISPGVLAFSNFPTMPLWNNSESNAARLSGKTIKLSNSSKQVLILEGKMVNITFDREIDLKKFEFLPKVSAKLVAKGLPSGAVPFRFESERGSYEVCETQQTAVLEAQLLLLDGSSISKEILSKTKVSAVYDGGEINLVLNDTTFRADLPLDTEFTSVSIKAIYSGYLNLQSNILTFTKIPCPKLKSKDARIEANVSILDLDDPFQYPVDPLITQNEIDITDAIFEKIELEEIENTGVRIKVEKKDGQLVILNDSRGFLCPSCFSQVGVDSAVYKLVAPGFEFEEDAYLTFVLNKTNASFFHRCGKCILSFILGILTLIYLVGLYRKPRFHRSAMMYYTEIDLTDTQSVRELRRFGRGHIKDLPQKPKSYKLRSKSWVSRWLLPFIPEKKTVRSITFIAAQSKRRVILPIKSQKLGMEIGGELIDPKLKKDLVIDSSSGSQIKIKSKGISNLVKVYQLHIK